MSLVLHLVTYQGWEEAKVIQQQMLAAHIELLNLEPVEDT
jgi:hypothetical protein